MNLGLNSSSIQRMNTGLVFDLLRKHQASTRTELARITGLTKATISNIVNSLIDIELLHEYPMESIGVGRRSIGLKINPDRFHLIQLRITNKKFYIGRYNLEGTEYEYYTKKYDPFAFLSNEILLSIKEYIKNMIKADNEILGIGISLPGPYHSGKYLAEIGELENWGDINICEEIEKEFNIPVYVENDANVGALGEWWLDRSITNEDTLIYITTATGTGSGVISNGKLLRGSQGIAGEIGHMCIDISGEKCKCGSHGCLELYTSTDVLLRQAHELYLKYPNTILNHLSSKRDFFNAVIDGDTLAIHIFDTAMKYLSRGIINIIYLYDPSIIIFGDEIINYGAGDRLLDIVKKQVKKSINPELYKNIDIKLSSSKIDSALLGAGILVINNISDILYDNGTLQ